MAKSLCAAAVVEVVQNPALPRHLISQLQPALALPQEQRVELLPVAISPEWARPAPVAPVKSTPQMTSQVFLEVASGSFPALAFLFLLWLLSTSRILCLLTTPFSFAIFSSHSLASATGFGDFFGVGDGDARLSCWLFSGSSPGFSSSLLTCPRRRLPAIAPSATAVASQRRKRDTATERNRATRRDQPQRLVKRL